MSEAVLSLIGLALVLFVSTNLDDIFVLLGFFSDTRFRLGHIVAGQYCGIALLVLTSLAASAGVVALSPRHVGLLGLLPIIIGLVRLASLRRNGPGHEDTVKARPGFGQVFVVAAVTVANGGDNVSIYAPVFATRPASDIAVLVAVFTGMTAVWLMFSRWLVNHPWVGAPLRRYGHVLMPFVLIALGCLIVSDAEPVFLTR